MLGFNRPQESLFILGSLVKTTILRILNCVWVAMVLMAVLGLEGAHVSTWKCGNGSRSRMELRISVERWMDNSLTAQMITLTLALKRRKKRASVCINRSSAERCSAHVPLFGTTDNW